MTNPPGPDPAGRHVPHIHVDALIDAQHGGESGIRAADVLQQLRVVLHAVKSHFQEVERITGVGGAQVWALSVIKGNPGIGISELARSLSIRQPTASIFVKNLAAKGLIRARRAASDRRAVQLTVLAAGEAVLQRAPQPFTGVLPQALAAVGPAGLERLHAELAKVVIQLGDPEGLRTTPLDQI